MNKSLRASNELAHLDFQMLQLDDGSVWIDKKSWKALVAFLGKHGVSTTIIKEKTRKATTKKKGREMNAGVRRNHASK